MTREALRWADDLLREVSDGHYTIVHPARPPVVLDPCNWLWWVRVVSVVVSVWWYWYVLLGLAVKLILLPAGQL